MTVLLPLVFTDIFDQGFYNRSNRPDNPGNPPVEREKTPDQVKAGDGWPVDGHDCSQCGIMVLLAVLLLRNVVSANGVLVVQMQQCAISAHAHGTDYNQENADGNKD